MSVHPPVGTDAPTVDPAALQVTVAQGPTRAVITVTGELDLQTAPLMRTAIVRPNARQDLLLDLSGLTFMDSTGVHLLLSCRSQAVRHGTRLQVRAGDTAMRVLQLCGLEERFVFVDQAESAASTETDPVSG